MEKVVEQVIISKCKYGSDFVCKINILAKKSEKENCLYLSRNFLFKKLLSLVCFIKPCGKGYFEVKAHGRYQGFFGKRRSTFPNYRSEKSMNMLLITSELKLV